LNRICISEPKEEFLWFEYSGMCCNPLHHLLLRCGEKDLLNKNKANHIIIVAMIGKWQVLLFFDEKRLSVSHMK